MSRMASRRSSVGKVVPHGSVGAFLEALKTSAVGFDITTQTCHVLPKIEPLTISISHWQEGSSELYNVVYNVLDKNKVLRGRSGKKPGRFVNKWSNKFTKCAMTWPKLLDASPTEIVSRIFSGLPFYELPCGSMKAEEWCKAHVPSILWLLYRGLPAEKRSQQGEDVLLDAWKKHVQRSLKGEDARRQGCEHRHIAIKNFDEFTSTRWILQPEEKHGEERRRVDVVRVVQHMRGFLLTHQLYLDALDDLHAGLMADLAGRWYCDCYELYGPSGYFTGNNYGRYIADILNPYASLSQQHQKTFIHNGLQHRMNYQHIVDPQSFFEACMAEPATDVGCESTFTMLYIAMLESTSKDRWGECCQIIDQEEVSVQALKLIPSKDAEKVLVRMEDPLLNEWFEVCKVISETVAQVNHDLDVETPCRKAVFPELLRRLGFEDGERVELCRSVDGFYTQLYNLRTRGKYTSVLSPCLRCRTSSPVHQKILHMFHGLQVLHCVYEAQQSMERAQLQRASSSTGAVGERHDDDAFPEVAYQRWLDPEGLFEDLLLKPLLNRSWCNAKAPSLSSWRRCFSVMVDVTNPELKQRAVLSMAIELACFVSSDIGMENHDLYNIFMWVLAEQGAFTTLWLKHISVSQKLKIELPHHLKRRGCVAEDPVDPRNKVAKVQQAVRDARSRTTHQGMERLGGAIMVADAQAQNVRSESPPLSKTFVGWSAALPPDCIGQLIGARGHNIQRLQRELQLIKLTVVKKDGSEYLRIEAATQARLSSAQRALLDEVAWYLRPASSTRKRNRW